MSLRFVAVGARIRRSAVTKSPLWFLKSKIIEDIQLVCLKGINHPPET